MDEVTPDGRCVQTGKVAYRNRLDAARLDSVVGIYRCGACGCWHRSSKPRRDNIERAKKARNDRPPGEHRTDIGSLLPQDVVESLQRLIRRS